MTQYRYGVGTMRYVAHRAAYRAPMDGSTFPSRATRCLAVPLCRLFSYDGGVICLSCS
jgi:hypothetical protein